MKAIRQIFARLHRYAGLSLALFLTISGLTGSIIVFQHELDEWLNPQLYRATGTGEQLLPTALARRIEQIDPNIRVRYLQLGVEPGHSATAFVEPHVDAATGQLFEVNYDQIFFDPATGEIIGTRHWGAFRVDRVHLIPLLYEVHRRLHLPGTWGIWLMGGVALIWTIDCFLGFYLTLPPSRPFLMKWKPAWKVRTDGSTYRLNLDLHRASGLWVWGLLLMLTISGVSFNLHKEVFEPVVSAISPITPSVFDTREMRPPERPIETNLSFDEILARAQTEARARGWPQNANGVFYAADYGVFGVGFGKEHAPGLGNPWVYFDGQSGRLVDDYVPGEGTAGDIFDQLQYPLHSGQVAGLPGRILIFITGVVVAMLSITGVVVWWTKRKALKTGKAKTNEHALLCE